MATISAEEQAYAAAYDAVHDSIEKGLASKVLDEMDVLSAVFNGMAAGCTCGKHPDDNAARFRDIHRALFDLEEDWPLA